jgi:hypothetical protein
MKAIGRIIIAGVLSIFIITLAVESEAGRANYSGRGHLSRPGHFKSSHKRDFHRGNYKYSHKNYYRSGYYKNSYKHYYGYGAKHRYGYKGSRYGYKHYKPTLYYGHGYKHGFNLHLGHGLDGRYGYGKYHPFRYPHWRSHFHKSYKTNRYFAEYSYW